MCQTSPIIRVKPSILTRYLAVKVAADMGVALLLLIFLYSVVDLVELKSISGIGTLQLFSLYLLKLPTTAALLLPLAAALGAAYETAWLRRTGEWDAMHAVGVSPAATFYRLLSVPVCCMPVAFGLSFFVGPAATARFESKMRLLTKDPQGECRGGWTKQHIGFVRFACDNKVDTILQVDRAENEITRYSRIDEKSDLTDKDTPVAIWTKTMGWQIGHLAQGLRQSQVLRPVAAPSANTLLGQSLNYSELEKAIADTRRMGLSEAALRAERALRIAVGLACSAVPAVTLGLLFMLKTTRTGRAVLLSISVTTVYWLFSAAAWNGVAAGLWQDAWLAVGVPFGFSVLFGSIMRLLSRFFE